MISQALRLLYTVRYLKPIQIYWRPYLGLKQRLPVSARSITRINWNRFSLSTVIERPECYRKNRFTFLNESIAFADKIDWNKARAAKLWLYNLHYFDWLQQADISEEDALTQMQEWIDGNVLGDGNGWEPYPLSLRIVNWIKYFQRTKIRIETLEPFLLSLYQQARVLRQNLEFHLLGNHLFKNAVALVFAGRSFSGREAEEWYRKGRTILLDQLQEQILDDGGHFERSPMYHALILEDVLDCLNLIQADSEFEDEALERELKARASAMLSFLIDILHPDGSLPCFNDTAQGISPDAQALVAYAYRLGVNFSKDQKSILKKPDFGLYVLESGAWRCIIDAGNIGPDYLPGHAHCDTLSYELSLAGSLIIVNSGVFQYAGEERNNYRATRAHNTVEIDGAEQHEIWSTFRVARRGYPKSIRTVDDGAELVFTGQHTGYCRLAGRPVHRRDLKLSEKAMTVTDHVIGKGYHRAKSFIHLHPSTTVVSEEQSRLEAETAGIGFYIVLPGDCQWYVTEYNYSPEFGLKRSAKVVIIEKSAEADFAFSYTIERVDGLCAKHQCH